MKSIQSRLFIGVVLVLSVLLIGQWFWLSSSIDRFIETQISDELKQESETILANIERLPSGVVIQQALLNDRYLRPFSGLYYRVDSDGDTWLSRSIWDYSFAKVNVRQGEPQLSLSRGPSQQQLMLLSRQYQKFDRLFTITVGKDISHVLAEKSRTQQMFSLFSGLGLVFFIVIQTWLIRKVLQPLARVKRQLRQLEQGEITALNENAPSEIKPLLTELNHLLLGFTQKTARSRKALGNLAHSLKTQLALLNQTADATDTDVSLIQHRVHQHSETIKKILDKELKRARLVGLAIPGNIVVINDVITDLTTTLELIYQDKQVIIERDISTRATVKIDREDVTELLGNVLDNAAKWCEKEVYVRVLVDSEVIIIIEDDGPGCDCSDLSQLTQRGYRADESVAGSGLGLSIVHDILTQYRGRIAFDHSEKLGGLQVVLHLQAFNSN